MNIRPVLLMLVTAVLASTSLFARDLTDRAVDFISLSRAARDGDIISVKVLINRGVDPNGVTFDDSNSASYLAHNYERPIQAAAEHGHTDVVQYLLSKGANPDWCCCSCVTALHLAILGSHEDVVSALLEAGANKGLPFEDGRSCLELAQDIGHKRITALVAGTTK